MKTKIADMTQRLTEEIKALVDEADHITKNLSTFEATTEQRLELMDRVGRLSGTAIKLGKARRIMEEAAKIHATISY